MHASIPSADTIDPYVVSQEIEDIKHEAQEEEDQEKLDFMDGVTELIWYGAFKQNNRPKFYT